MIRRFPAKSSCHVAGVARLLKAASAAAKARSTRRH